MAEGPKVSSGGKVLLAIIAIGAFLAIKSMIHHGAPAPAAKITRKLDSFVVLDAQHVRLWTTWTNAGKGSGSASCVVDVTAYSPYGDEIGSGADSTGTNGNLKPGATQTLYQDIVVTDNNAAGVTRLSDFSISNC